VIDHGCSENFLNSLLEKSIRPLVDEFSHFIHTKIFNLRTILPRLDIKHRHIFGPDAIRAGLFELLRPVGEIPLGRLPNPPQDPQDEMLAVGFEQESVLVLAEGGFDED